VRMPRRRTAETCNSISSSPEEDLEELSFAGAQNTLFLNAAGIVLEVGGMLQHGALVAREYGKPCVSSLQSAAKVLRDGQVVELDGTDGIVRLVGEPSFSLKELGGHSDD
jgi:phosphoenolpyruvate synthase/pyruvate phosphate dikinase